MGERCMQDIVTRFTMKSGNNWGTGIVISTDDGKILLGLRKDTKDWTTPGGKVDVGETALQGVLRETKEECGLDISKMKVGGFHFLGTEVQEYGSKVWINFLFCLTHLPLDMREDVVPQPTEFITWEWVTIEQALEMKLFPPAEITIRKLQEMRRLQEVHNG